MIGTRRIPAHTWIGLAIILAIFRNKGTVDIEEINLLRW